jgi:hypothetical protein
MRRASGVTVKLQAHLAVVVAALACRAVARQDDAAAGRDRQRLFVVAAGGEIHGVDERLPGVAQVGQGDGEVAFGRGDAVVVPTFDAQPLQEAQRARIEGDLLQVAVQQRRPRPADLRQPPLRVEEG